MRRWALLALFPLLVLGLLVTAARYLACTIAVPSKATKIALMIDETCNVAANGRVDESISRRAAKARQAHRWWGCVLCWALDRIARGHCDDALNG